MVIYLCLLLSVVMSFWTFTSCLNVKVSFRKSNLILCVTLWFYKVQAILYFMHLDLRDFQKLKGSNISANIFLPLCTALGCEDRVLSSLRDVFVIPSHFSGLQGASHTSKMHMWDYVQCKVMFVQFWSTFFIFEQKWLINIFFNLLRGKFYWFFQEVLKFIAW